jgi:molybdopterin biosynthesis enzyme
MARANALAVVPDGDGVRLGDQVEVILLEEPPTQEWA